MTTDNRFVPKSKITIIVGLLTGQRSQGANMQVFVHVSSLIPMLLTKTLLLWKMAVMHQEFE